jgi:hypothetical protein
VQGCANQVVQGSPEALGPKWLIGNRHRPSGLVWSGEDTLCGGHGDPLPWWRSSLVEAASNALGRDLVTGKKYSCVSASTTWTRGGLVAIDTMG